MSSAVPSAVENVVPSEPFEGTNLRVVGEESSLTSPPEPTPNVAGQPPERIESDADLLHLFVSSKDRDAFEAIVRRYERLVMGVALRQVGDRHRAEDVFQATFLVLAEQAERIRRPESLASWLHGTARRIGLSALKDSRRHSAMSHVTSEPTTDPDGQVLAEMQRAFEQQTFDEELANLPDSLRLPLVLHYLEGLTAHEVAQRLGLSTDAVEGRLKKGRKELRQRLVRHGIGFGIVLAAFQQSQQIAAASTGSLAEATAASSVAWVTHQPLQACTANAARLAGKELIAMAAAKTSTLLTGAAILGIGTGLLGAFALADSSSTGRGGTVGSPTVNTVAEDGEAAATGESATVLSLGPGAAAGGPLFEGDGIVIGRRGNQITIAAENPGALDRIEKLLIGNVETLQRLDLLHPQDGVGAAVPGMEGMTGMGMSVAGSDLYRNLAPTGTTGTPAPAPAISGLRVEVDAAGRIRINGRRFDRESLKVLLDGLHPAGVTFMVDLDTPQATLAELIALARDAGATSTPVVSKSEWLGGAIGDPLASPVPKRYAEFPPSRQKIEGALDASTLPNLAGAILREFVALIGENLGIPVRIDEAALEESGVPTDIDVDVPEGLSNRETLSFVLEPLDLDYIVKNGVLTVTTREVADNFRETVIYELRHLHPAIPANDTAAVTDLMMNSTSGPWADYDGDGGTISELPGGLAVRQSQRVHREIVALLEQLEQFASRKDLPVVPQTLDSTESRGGFGGGGLGGGSQGGFGGGGVGGFGGGGTN